MSNVNDIGAGLVGRLAFVQAAQTAGAETEIDGITIDRDGLGSSYQSAKLIVGIRATLDTDETFAIAANIQDSANDSDWSDYTPAVGDSTIASSTIMLTGAATEGTAQTALDFNIGTARRYVRVQVTPDLSRAGTDTCEVCGVVVLGGADILPAS